jgi:hypothetical protein
MNFKERLQRISEEKKQRQINAEERRVAQIQKDCHDQMVLKKYQDDLFFEANNEVTPLLKQVQKHFLHNKGELLNIREGGVSSPESAKIGISLKWCEDKEYNRWCSITVYLNRQKNLSISFGGSLDQQIANLTDEDWQNKFEDSISDALIYEQCEHRSKHGLDDLGGFNG